MRTVSQLAILATAVAAVTHWPNGLTVFTLLASSVPIAALGQG
jgi:hypothetical protein